MSKTEKQTNQLGSLHIHRMQNICSPHAGWTRSSHLVILHRVYNSYIETEKIHHLWECDCNEQTHVAPIWPDTEFLFERRNRLEHVENMAIWCLAASKALCHQHFGVAQRATMSTHKLAEGPITLVLATSMAVFFHYLATLPQHVMKACNSEACHFAWPWVPLQISAATTPMDVPLQHSTLQYPRVVHDLCLSFAGDICRRHTIDLQ